MSRPNAKRLFYLVILAGIWAMLRYCGQGVLADEPPDVLGPYTAAGNFAADLFGAVDTRPGTWGRADAVVWKQTLTPPAGYRVRVLEVVGDFVAWPTDYGIGPALADPGRCYGVLAGLHTTDADGVLRGGSAHGLGPLLADDTLFYVQGAACGSTAINKDFRVDLRGVSNNLLNVNHMLVWKVASWLNDTGFPVHIEVTYSSARIVFEKDQVSFR